METLIKLFNQAKANNPDLRIDISYAKGMMWIISIHEYNKLHNKHKDLSFEQEQSLETAVKYTTNYLEALIKTQALSAKTPPMRSFNYPTHAYKKGI